MTVHKLGVILPPFPAFDEETPWRAANFLFFPFNCFCWRSGTIRLISGQWRGRKLPVHDVEGLRPTTDRVKETLFNWLATDVRHSRCLDVFAGSGSLI